MLLGFPRAFWISLCNVVGLAFSLFGLLLLFFYALPNEIPGSPGFIAFSPGWQEKQRHYETCTHWGFALALSERSWKAFRPSA
jgi:hypothetical protein